MFPSYLLSLREGIEAALIIGILHGALKKFNRRDFTPTVWYGAGSAALLSLAAALVLNAIGQSFEGRAEEIFEGVTMVIASGLLIWMIFWMRSHAKTMEDNLQAGIHRAARRDNGKRAVFFVAFLAVLREGVELALFITAVSLSTSPTQTLFGVALGLASAVVLGWLLFAGTVRLDLQRFFQVTSFLLILFAAGLLAHGVHEFNQAGIIPPIIEHVWDTNTVLDEKSVFGQLLKSLFGYNGNPSLTEVLAYFISFAALLLLLRPREVRLAAAQDGAG